MTLNKATTPSVTETQPFSTSYVVGEALLYVRNASIRQCVHCFFTVVDKDRLLDGLIDDQLLSDKFIVNLISKSENDPSVRSELQYLEDT